jgi:galactonate dehydratase
MSQPAVSRRSILGGFLGACAATGVGTLSAVKPSEAALVDPKDAIKITKIETFFVQPRSVFLKMSTDAGIVGWGEPCLEGKSETVAAEVHDLARYLVGQDPRQIVRHWDRMYKGLYRGGSVRVSAISGVDHALWDITGKALGLPVWQLLGGPIRDRVRVYWDPMPEDPPDLLMKKVRGEGYTAIKISAFSWSGGKTKRAKAEPGTPLFLQNIVANFLETKEAVGPGVDMIFHGGGGDYRQNMYMIKALEPHNLLFYEIHANNHNFDELAEIQRKTFIPIATGEDAYTRWEFRDVLVKDAARVLMPDLTHAGGITETRSIAAMAEAFERTISPHNAQGVINLAAAIHIGASIPNFLAIETTDRGIGDPGMQGWEGSWRGVDILKEPFTVVDGRIAIPTKPGLGIEIDENKLAKHITDKPWLLR